MNPPDALLQRLPSIEAADSYFCFCRSWWDGAGVDAAVWLRNNSGSFRKVVKTGETTTPRPPTFETDEPIEPAVFEELLCEILALGLLTLPQQTERIIYSHYDDWYGLKLNTADVGYWLEIKGGRHIDPKARLILNRVFQLAPEIVPNLPSSTPRG